MFLKLTTTSARQLCKFNLLNNSKRLLSFDLESSNGHYRQSNDEEDKRRRLRKDFLVYLGTFAGIVGLSWLVDKKKRFVAYCESNVKSAGHFRQELPTFTEEQVKEHNKSAERIWVTYKEGVYDITDFIKAHPGGPDKILLGAGGSIEPFWQIYPVHLKPETLGILEKHRIGNLKIDALKKKDATNDPFANEPKRHPLLKVLTAKPFNAESPKELSVDNLITPNDLHFVRNHLPVPQIDAKNFKLEIVVDSLSGDKRRFSFNLEELSKQFRTYTIPVTMQCSGNKRRLMNEYEPVQGLMWDVNAISNANWTGVLLKDVLDYCQVNINNSNDLKHVHFEGLDMDPSGTCYAASIPLDKVSGTTNGGDVLLAFKMNDADIPPDHGYPLRAVVPGVTGARSVKWLNRIVLSAEESKSHWQQNDYKLIPPSIKNLKEVDFSKYNAIQETPVQSAICTPVDGARVDKEDSSFVVKGYAFSGGGNSIEKVYVSADGGKTWQTAIVNQLQAPLYRCWSWAIWECEIEVPKDKSVNKVEIVCTAIDSQQNTQPESVKSIWNARGLVNNSWHKINVELV